jgi:hypothetical protein
MQRIEQMQREKDAIDVAANLKAVVRPAMGELITG